MPTPLSQALMAAVLAMSPAMAAAQSTADPFTPVSDDSIATTAAQVPAAISAEAPFVDDDTQTAPPMRFGYASYSYLLKAMPGYDEAQRQIKALSARYDEEAERAEREFNDKYEEFLEGQRDFPQSILQKRQTELQDLLTKNMAFRDESRRLLAAATNEIMAPLKTRLAAVLRTVGEQNGYAFILNTDGNTCLFMNMGMADDVTLLVTDQLRMGR